MTTEVSGTNPIIKQHPVTRFSFGTNRPVPGGHSVLVWKATNGRVYPVASPPTASELLLGTFQVYEVGVAQHPIQIRYDLPSNDSAMTFRATLRATWQVTDPVAVVRNVVLNAEAVHDSWLNELLRDAGSEYSIFDDQVERKINSVLATKVGHHQYGISIIALRIEISLDEATSVHVRETLRLQRQQELAVKVATLGVDQARSEQILHLQQQQHEQELAARAAQHAKELAAQDAENALRLETARREQDLRLRKAEEAHQLEMKQGRMKFYAEAAQQGNAGLLILHLVEHPEDVNSVLRFVLDQQKVGFDNSREMLKALIDADVLNPELLDDVQKQALGNMLDGLRPPGGGLLLPGPTQPAPAAIQDAPAMPASTSDTPLATPEPSAYEPSSFEGPAASSKAKDDEDREYE